MPADTRFLNLGSGPFYMPGWLNVDLYAEDADVTLNVLEGLPKEWKGRFEKVYCGHVLEHLPFARVPTVLRDIARCCAVGAVLTVVGPTLDLAVATNQPEWLLEEIRACPTPEMPGAGHEWDPTSTNTLEVVRTVFGDAAFIDLRDTLRPEWPNTVDAKWQVAIRGSKRPRTRSPAPRSSGPRRTPANG